MDVEEKPVEENEAKKIVKPEEFLAIEKKVD